MRNNAHTHAMRETINPIKNTREKNAHKKNGALRAYVLCPHIYESHSNGKKRGVKVTSAHIHMRLEEGISLARSIDLDVVEGKIIRIARPHPSFLLRMGKLSDFKKIFLQQHISLVIIDGLLSPVQQRNLERAWGVKVLDRTGLILEIFGRRARTKEGRLQVELAHLNWQKSRLVRSWTHLERQRGGFGFIGGPGETQIEADRRQIRHRITQLKQALEKVKRTRALHRCGRRRAGRKVVALVGYTNAGKSTLFNALTHADVFAGDMLFATLDPTMRRLKLEKNYDVTLADTVGFISDLPTTLVAAFRATLEDVSDADLILHIRDISHPDHDLHAETVTDILADLNIDPNRVLHVYNKMDQVEMTTFNEDIHAGKRKFIHVSALKREGLEQLKKYILHSLTTPLNHPGHPNHHSVFA